MQHSCSHYNAFCSITWQTPMYLRTWQHKMTTIMQAFQCNLQPEIPQTHRTTHTQTHPKQLEATATVRQKKTLERTYPQLPHTRAALHRRLQPLYTEKTPRFRASASSPTQAPCNIHASTTMRAATRDPTTAKSYAHTKTRKVQNTKGEPKTSKRAYPQPPHTRGALHRCLQPLYTEKHKVSCSSFLPNTSPQHSCSHSTASSCNIHAIPSLPDRFPIASLPLPYHFPSSPLPLVTTSLSHHFPESPCSLRRHFP